MIGLLGLLLVGVGIYLQNYIRISLVIVLLGGLILRLWAAHLDPFLHDWDEQFHALVARNLITQPLKPTLYPEPIFNYDYKNWQANYIWLHKSPIFLWQMALSMSIFGVNLFALRLPSILLSTGTLWLTYKIGKSVVGHSTALIATGMMAVAHYQLALVTGAEDLEHNDIAFLFYITLSLWLVLCKYYQRTTWRYAFLIGVASGGAVLNKWFIGTIPFLSWGILVLLQPKYRNRVKIYWQLGAALLVMLIVVSIWLVYILQRFPLEANYELTQYQRHFTEVIEGHSGSIFFHLQQIGTLYSPLFKYLLPIGFLFFIRGKNKSLIWARLSLIIAVYIFFSLAATKLAHYCIIVSPIMFIVGASAFEIIRVILFRINLSKMVHFAQSVAAGMSCIILFKYYLWFPVHSPIESNFQKNVSDAVCYQSIKTKPKSIALNVHAPIKFMFYTGTVAYSEVYPYTELKALQKQGYTILLFNSHQVAPIYQNDTTILKIDCP